jgi:hypothetical protein
VKDKPMKEVKATAADRAKLREALTATVLPGWVKRCGAKCGEVYNQVIAPISGVKYTHDQNFPAFGFSFVCSGGKGANTPCRPQGHHHRGDAAVAGAAAIQGR